MVVSDSSGSMQTPSIPSANVSTGTPTPGVTEDAAAIHISEDPHLVEEAGNKRKRNVPLLVYQKRMRRDKKDEAAAAATTGDPAATPNTSTPSELLRDPVESASGSMQTPSIPSANLSTVTPTPGVTEDAAAIHTSEDARLVKEAHIEKKCDVPVEVETVARELDSINQNTPEASEENVAWKKMAIELEERVAILEQEFTMKADELEAKVKSVEEAADRHIQEQQEKIDTLTAEKASITQELGGELKTVLHELEQHKKILEKERARISQFEVEKRKSAVLADVTATYNLLISLVVAVPDFDYTLIGDDIARKVEEIRIKLAKEEAKSAVKEAGPSGQQDVMEEGDQRS